MSQIVIKLPPKKTTAPATVQEPVATTAPTVAARPSSSSWIQTGLIIVAVLAAALILRGGGGTDDGGDGPQPVPVVSVEKTVADAARNRSLNDAAAMRKLAELIEEGKIDTQQAFVENAQAFTKAARVKAFEPIDQMDQQMVPKHTAEQPKWTDEQRRFMANYLRKQAKGFEDSVK